MACLPCIAVLVIDEVDTLVGDSLISVLRQLRARYEWRLGGFPQTVALCGVRDVRDWRIDSTAEKTVVQSNSAFNIKAESRGPDDFTEIEARALLSGHTAETRQELEESALARTWELT